MRQLAVVVLVGLIASTAACDSSSPSTPIVDAMSDAPVDGPPPVTLEVKDIPLALNRDVDLLFLIDDSPSMSNKQNNFTAGLPAFLDALATLPGGLPNLHIGVVTSDLGTQAALDATPGPGFGTLGQGGCAEHGRAGNLQLFGAPVSGGLFVSDVEVSDGSRLRNYIGTLSDTLATMVRAGSGGCGFEQSLEAVKQALAPTNAANQGFLRPDALLVVVLLTDEDDCSASHASLFGNDIATLGPLESFRCTRFGVVCDVGGATPDAMNTVGPKQVCHPAESSTQLTHVADYATFLKGLKADPGKVVVASIAGALDPIAVELRAPPATSLAVPALAHSCMYVDADSKPEVADPPVRIAALLDQFPNHSAAIPICQNTLALQPLVVPLRNAMLGGPCITGTIADLDPVTRGAQPGCDVSVVAAGSPDKVLPRCTPEDATATNPPCWHLADDPASCPSGGHARLAIEGVATLPANGHVVARCTVLAPG